MSDTPLLQVDSLKMHFPIKGGILQRQVATVFAVDGVSFHINEGETVGLVGESGCGKSTIGRCIVRLYRPNEGSIKFQGKDLVPMDGEELRDARKNIQMIFQDPAESLNARHTVGEILAEPFLIQSIGDSSSRRKQAKELLDRVGLPQTAINKYPHEFSGGQKQRIGIARAIALKPKLIVCDEPVSALDVSIQSQIVNLLVELQKEMGLSYLFIAHDLSVVRHVSDRVAVMYLGKIVEQGDADKIYRGPKHPYAQALLQSIPVPDPEVKREHRALQGDVPSPINPPSGCHFRTRCPYVKDDCQDKRPQISTDEHQVACHFPLNQ